MSFSSPLNLFLGGQTVKRRTNRTPRDELERGLALYTAIPEPEAGSDRLGVIKDRSFLHIARILTESQVSGYMRFSDRPRIFTILRWLGRENTYHEFVKASITDHLLPLTDMELPPILGPDRANFVKMQEHCLTDAVDIEKGEKGRHLSISDSGLYYSGVRELGSGGFGTVDVVRSRLSLKQYARKRFARGSNSRETRKKFEFFEKEMKALKRLSHKHLVKIRGSYTDPKCFAFLMEPVASYDLEEYLGRVDDTKKPSLRQFFGCLTEALVYLHDNKVHHLDIKPKNILILKSKVYMADFGAARDWSDRERSTTFSYQIRTTAYMPPERDSDPNAPCNYYTDIWSLGIVFLEMLTVLRGARTAEFWTHLRQKGQPCAFKNIPGITSWLQVLRERDGPEYDNVPQTWVRDMLVKEAQRRPYARQLRDLIKQASGFSCFECAMIDQEPQHELLPYSMDEAQSICYSANEQAGDHEQQQDEHVMESSKSDAIQAWIHRTETEICHGRDPSTFESQGLEFDISDDDERSEVRMEVFDHALRPISQRLSSFDLGAGLGTMETPCGDSQLTFVVGSDRSEGSGSDCPGPAELSSDENALAKQLEELDDVLEGGKLPTITEEAVSESSPILCFDVSDDEATEELQRPSGFLQSNIERAAFVVESGDGSPGAGNMDAIGEVIQATGTTTDVCALPPRPACGDHSPTPAPPTLSTQPGLDLTQIRDVSEGEAPASGSLGLATNSERPGSKVTPAASPADIPETQERSMVPESSSPVPRSVEDVNSGDLKSTQQPLTAANLSEHDQNGQPAHPESTHRTRKPRRISAKKWMRKVSVETSSEATSVMSEGTRQKIQGLGFSVWTVKHLPLLTRFARTGGVAAVRALLDQGIKPTRESLMVAVRGGSMRHVKCAVALLQKGAPVNAKSTSTGKSALSIATEHDYYRGYKLLIYQLLRHGANPNNTDKSGDSPLLQMLYNGYEPLEEYRREALALVFQDSTYPVEVNVSALGTGNTPLHLAVQRKDEYATGMLIAKGANISTRNAAGQTPFALAVSGWTKRITPEQQEIIRELLKAGADANEHQGPSESTALHSSVAYGLVDLTRLLLRYQADPSRKDKRGQTAFMVCEDALSNGKLTQAVAESISALLTWSAVESNTKTVTVGDQDRNSEGSSEELLSTASALSVVYEGEHVESKIQTPTISPLVAAREWSLRLA